jgi:integrase
MPARLALGSWGKIRHYPVGDSRWRATTLIRDYDGKTRQIQRIADTKTKATRRLTDYLTERTADSAILNHTDTHVRDLVPHYLDQIRAEQADTTYDRYESRIRNHVLPHMGDLLVREVTPVRINGVYQAIRAHNPGIAPGTLRGIRDCISGLMKTAIEHGLLAHNPVAAARQIRGGTVRAARAYDTAQVVEFLAKVDADEQAKHSDLPDLIRVLFGTGCRFGEALALRWSDLNLTDQRARATNPDNGDQITLPPRSVWFNGNLVIVKHVGVVRHRGKTEASTGVIGLPDFLHALLLERAPVLVAGGVGGDRPVFPSARGGWRTPTTVQRSISRMCRRIGHEGFSTHVGRKTVATLLAEEGQSARQIADQLRHSSLRTSEVYIARGLANPAAAKAIDAAHRPTPPTQGDGT